MDNIINWDKIREKFEKDMIIKLGKLPGHRDVAENLKEFRSIISHELPETSSSDLFNKLIDMFLSLKSVDLSEIKEKYLDPEIGKERNTLNKHRDEFKQIRQSATDWVKKNLSEEQLQTEWKEHKTWLPRRYTIYKNPILPFQEIAIDTLSRYYLISSNVKILS